MRINEILVGEGLKVLKTIEDKVVDCCVTSPPYWGLRDYGDDEQLGLEPDFNDYIIRLCNIFDEVKRILKDEGTCWVNIADTYYTKSGTGFLNDNLNPKNKEEMSSSTGINKANEIRGLGLLPEKSLCNIPSRFSIEMQNRGWILRNEIIWHKPSVMPSSASDRFTIDFEKIYFFVKQKKYYFEQQLEESIWANKDNRFGKHKVLSKGKSETNQYSINGVSYRDDGMRNMRTTWSITTKPSSEDHYAMYPEKLIVTPIKAGCPENGIVLDPFMGSGTTGIVARKFNRNYLGIELNPKNVQIANKRIYNELGLFQ